MLGHSDTQKKKRESVKKTCKVGTEINEDLDRVIDREVIQIPINLHVVLKTQFQRQQDPNLTHALQLFLSEALVSFQVKVHERIAVLLTAV